MDEQKFMELVRVNGTGFIRKEAIEEARKRL